MSQDPVDGGPTTESREEKRVETEELRTVAEPSETTTVTETVTEAPVEKTVEETTTETTTETSSSPSE